MEEQTFILGTIRGGGVIKKYRVATEADADGVVFVSLVSENHPGLARLRRLRGIFLIASPPLLAVMQGGEYA
jgi:hypothetical protein